MNNSIFSIRPYRKGSIWAFDEPELGLLGEVFVMDVNRMIELMLDRAGLPEDQQFTGMFSSAPFPGYHMLLRWMKEEFGGNWYYDTKSKLHGWLCPALLKFFDEAPRSIYVRAEP